MQCWRSFVSAWMSIKVTSISDMIEISAKTDPAMLAWFKTVYASAVMTMLNAKTANAFRN